MTKQIKKILICIASAQHSKNALLYATNLAKKHDYVIEILSVIDTSSKEYRSILSIEKSLRSEKRQKIEEEINTLARSTPRNIRVAINIKEGFVTEEIAQTISNDKSIKLLVLASSPDSQGTGKLIPYITEKLSEKYFLPMVIIPSTLTDTEISKLS